MEAGCRGPFSFWNLVQQSLGTSALSLSYVFVKIYVWIVHPVLWMHGFAADECVVSACVLVIIIIIILYLYVINM
jgi:hypothetical protein